MSDFSTGRGVLSRCRCVPFPWTRKLPLVDRCGSDEDYLRLVPAHRAVVGGDFGQVVFVPLKGDVLWVSWETGIVGAEEGCH